MWHVIAIIVSVIACLGLLAFVVSIGVCIVDAISEAMSGREAARLEAAQRAWQVQQVRQYGEQRLHQQSQQAMEQMVRAVRETGGWPT